MKIFFLLFAISFLFVTETFSQKDLPQAFEINIDTATYLILPYMKWQYFFEKDQKLTLKDVLKPSFSSKFTFPDSSIIKKVWSGRLWLRYKIKNNLPKPLDLTIPEGEGRADIYVSTTPGNWKHYVTGTEVPWSKRDGLKKILEIIHTIPPKGEITVYEIDETRSVGVGTRVSIGIISNIMTKIYVEDDIETIRTITWSFLTGFCLSAAIFNFFFFYIVREKVYLLYSILLLSYTLTSQPLLDLLLREIPQYKELIRQMASGIVLYLFLGTTLNFLQVSKNHPIWNKLLLRTYLIFLMDLIVSICLIYFSNEHEISLIPLKIIGLISLFSRAFIIVGLIIIIVTDLTKKQRSSRLFMLAIMPLLFSTIFSMLFINRFDNSANVVAGYIFVITMIWAITVFSWSLFERFKILSNENAQQALEKERFFREKEEERGQLIAQQNEKLEQQVSERTSELSRSIMELKSTQAQLIQSEKMASLGELTAGIAHEIQNPLNFVNNFSEINKELLEELKNELDGGSKEDVISIANDVIENEQKINLHGKRADAIVKGMLQHSRTNTGKKEPTDINGLADEYLRLSYHGFRAKDKSFNATIETHFDDSIGKVEIVPQDIGRVLLNLYNNAFYAVAEKKRQIGESFEPVVSVTTGKLSLLLGKGGLEIAVRDNGSGIPQKVVDKIFQPFFTTKPTGQGTGLGLSLSYDIIKAHGGEIKVETKEGEGVEFIIKLPF